MQRGEIWWADLPTPTDETGLPQVSVVNVSQVITVDKTFLVEQVSQVSDRIMLLVDCWATHTRVF